MLETDRRVPVTRRTASAVLVALVLAGCGTTVPQRTAIAGNRVAGPNATTTDSQDESGTTDPAATAATTTDGSPSTGSSGSTPTAAPKSASGSAGAAGAPGAVGQPSATTVTTVVSGAGTKNGGATSAPKTGASQPARGAAKPTPTTGSAGAPSSTGPAKAAPVNLGIIVTGSDAQAASTLGVNAANGDEQSMAKAVVANINAHGGLGGRTVNPVIYVIDPTKSASEPLDQIYAEICSYFTEDHRVTAVAYAVYFAPLAECFGKANEAYITSSALEPLTLGDLDNYPLYFGLTMPTDLRAKAFVNGLFTQGYYAGKAPVGLIVEDIPGDHFAVDQFITPMFRATGITTDVVYTPPSSSQNLSSIGSADANAIVRFRSESVDHVMFFAPYSIQAISFIEQAQSQQYYPRYGIDTGSTPTVLSSTSAIQTRSLHGSVGIGFYPEFDADPSSWMGDPPGLANCVKIGASVGLSYTKGSSSEASLAYTCDMLFEIQAAANLASPGTLTAQTLVAGAEKIGASYQPAAAKVADFTSRAAAPYYQLLAYTDSCSCYRYTSNAMRVN